MLLDILNNLDIKISGNDYDSTIQPFFINDNNKNDYCLDSNGEISNNINSVKTLLDNEYFIKLPENIKEFYSIINTINKEIYINYWTFFSLSNTLERYNNYYKKDEIYTIDLAFRYLGMGWIQILFYDHITNKLYLRRDGGSNGFDREFNYNELIKFCKNKSDYVDENFITKSYIDIIEFFEEIKNDSL